MWQLPPLTPEEILYYLRKSRADNPLLTVEEVLSRHEQRLDEWVERMLPGMGAVPQENRHREIVSGETLDSRPEVQKALRRAESSKIKAIACADPQRLSRGDYEDIGRLVKRLRYSDTIVITPDFVYDLRDERDRESFERELKRGNDFLEYQKKILYNGRLLSVSNGNFIARHAPYGYRKIVIQDGKEECHTLEIIEEEAEGVRIMFDMYAKGYGGTVIADRLFELGIHPRKSKRWAPNTIRGILKNEHYLGMVRWEHKKEVKTVVDGEIISRRPTAEDYLLFPGKQPAIIDQATWDAVHERMGKNPRNKKASNLSNPFAGILYCSCGKAMKLHTFVHKGVVKAAPRMQCPEQRFCENASCLLSEITAEVKKILRETLEDFEVRIEAGEDDSIDVQRRLVERLERRMAELEALELSQWEKRTLEAMPKHIFDTLNAKVLAEKEEVQQALCTAKGSIPAPIDLPAKVSTFRAVLDMMDEPGPPIRELNELLKACIERIEYRRPKTQSMGANSRWQTGQPIELDVKLRV